MYDYKKLIGELLGAGIAIVWISYGILGAGSMVFLAVAISLTILFGVLSGGFIALSQNKADYKEIIGWVLGAAIGVTWIIWALLFPGDLIGLVIAISITIVFGVLSGGLIALSKKQKK